MCIRDSFYFMEMNTRIQVEHPVTEEITGLDLVTLQLKIAAGERLPFEQKDVRLRGHAIEVRITAEDEDFKPRAGLIEKLFVPGGRHVRWDSPIYAGYKVPPNYDSMIAKLIVWGETRDQAIDRMRRALDELVIEGIPTSAGLHKRIMANVHFQRGNATTAFLDEYFHR